MSPFSPRIREDVITDLMIHDLDVVRSIAGCGVVDVQCMAMRVHSDTEDLATALLRFENGMTANLTASRVGQQKIRELRITQPDRYVTVDLVRQDVTINRVEHSEFLSSDGARYRQSGIVEIPFLEHQGEPLLLELQEFVRAASTGTTPRVTAAEGVEALRLVERVQAAARMHGLRRIEALRTRVPRPNDRRGGPRAQRGSAHRRRDPRDAGPRRPHRRRRRCQHRRHGRPSRSSRRGPSRRRDPSRREPGRGRRDPHRAPPRPSSSAATSTSCSPATTRWIRSISRRCSTRSSTTATASPRRNRFFSRGSFAGHAAAPRVRQHRPLVPHEVRQRLLAPLRSAERLHGDHP